jgi:hypothetical protein
MMQQVLQSGTSALQSQVRQPQGRSVSVRCMWTEGSSTNDHSVFSVLSLTDCETDRFREVRKVYADHRSERASHSSWVDCDRGDNPDNEPLQTAYRANQNPQRLHARHRRSRW